MKIRALSQIVAYSKEYNVVSFDLFDTLIYRESLSLDAIKEASAHYFVGLLVRSKAPRNFTVVDVVSARTQFTIMLKGSTKVVTEEPSIQAVYRAMAMSRGVSSDDAAIIAEKTTQYEFDLDCVSLRLLPGAQKVLSELSEQGKTMFLLSDMYYQKAHILKILAQFSIDHHFEDVFVSSTSGKTKQTSNLFSTFVEEKSLRPEDVLHIGDNPRSDVEMAVKAGLNAVYFNSGTHYAAEKFTPDSTGPVLDKFANMSSFFVLKVLQQAWSLGLEKVFFLTRDATALGSLLNSLANEAAFLQPMLDQVELRELAISRSSATFLELNAGESALEEVLLRFCWIFGGSFRMQRLQEFLQGAACGAFETDFLTPLADYQVGEKIESEADFLRVEHADIADKIVAMARSLGDTTFNYLRQEGAVGQGDVGFVDVGYTATVTRNVAHYLSKEADEATSSNTHIHLFFMASGVLLPNNLEASISHVTPQYVMNEFAELPTILRTNYCWFECFAKDYSRGALLGYRRDQGRYVPVFASERAATGPLAAWSAAYSPQNEDVLRLLSRRNGNLIIKDYLSEMAFPTNATIEYMDTLSHGCGLMDDDERSILNRNLTLFNFMPNGLREMIRQDYWIAGSIRASGFGNWANIWVGSAINIVRQIKIMHRDLKTSAREATKRALGRP